MKVGDLLWRRNGASTDITGETKVSWIIGESSWAQEKISKKSIRETGTDGHHWPSVFSTQEAAAECRFVDNNSYHISRLVRDVSDPAILRKIAELIGYTEEKRG